jgi:UTP--glucose-1-phosphate uridylyltransferase
MDEDALNLEIIVNNKVTDAGQAVIQLETGACCHLIPPPTS